MNRYIVTTTRYLPSPEDRSTTEYVECVEVATLDGAIDAAIDRLSKHMFARDYADAVSAITSLPKSGGTVTLPDGTVIEVVQS